MMHQGRIKIKSDIEWGERYRDTITGFEGIMTGYCAYISGCDQALLNGGMNKDGDKVVSMWFDVDRLVHLATDRPVGQAQRLRGPDTAAPIK